MCPYIAPFKLPTFNFQSYSTHSILDVHSHSFISWFRFSVWLYECVYVCARAVNQWLTEAYQKRLNILWNRRFVYIHGIVCICAFFSSVIWKMLLWLKRLKKWVGIQFFASRISHEMSHWMEFIARSSHFSFFHTSLFFFSHSLPTIFIFPFGSSVKMFSCIFIKTRNSIWLHRLMNRVTSDAIK